MKDQVNIPAFPKDRDKFKIMAIKKGKSMKALFHEWIERRQEWEKVK
jgi:hypothetical protein